MKGRVERLEKERFLFFRERAVGLAQTMEESWLKAERHGALLSAIHSAISAADALTIFYLGERSRGQDHHELVSLLGRLPLDNASEYAQRASSILSKKTAAEYGSGGLTLRETERVLTQTRRFLKWALASLPT
jgi:hypothetical protein